MEKSIAGYNQEEWEKIEKDFNRDLENSRRYNKPFREIMEDILKGETYLSFESKTGLSQNMYYRLLHEVDEKDPPQRSTIISVCVGYNLDILMAQALLESLGLEFNRFKKRDYAYSFLLTRCRGKDVDECNEILKALGVEEKHYLGYHARRKVSQKKEK